MAPFLTVMRHLSCDMITLNYFHHGRGKCFAHIGTDTPGTILLSLHAMLLPNYHLWTCRLPYQECHRGVPHSTASDRNSVHSKWSTAVGLFSWNSLLLLSFPPPCSSWVYRLGWSFKDSVPTPAREQYLAGLQKVLQKAAYALNYHLLYDTVSPVAKIYRCSNEGVKWECGTTISPSDPPATFLLFPQP